MFINQKSGSYFASTPQQSIQAFLQGLPVPHAQLADIQNTGGLSLLLSNIYSPIDVPAVYSLAYLKHTGNPAPSPPEGVAIAGSVGQHPVISWALNQERDINGYKVYRKVSPDESQFSLIATLGPTTWSYTDPGVTIRSGGTGGQWAQYYVKAFDSASNLSDASATVTKAVNYYPPKIGVGEMASSEVQGAPRDFILEKNYPNPFNPGTNIQFALPEPAYVRMSVTDLLGQEVATLVEGSRASGYHTVRWNAQGVGSGVYFCRMIAQDESGQVCQKVIRMMVAK